MIVAFLKRAARQWPHMRATTSQWPLWIARQLLMPAWRLPLTIRTRQGTRVRLGDDRVDDIVLLSVVARSTELYFPRIEDADFEGVILDLGAHHGIYAVEALRRYPRCRLIAVEPDPQSCQRIAANVALNEFEPRVRIVNAGLGMSAGRGVLEPDASGSWGTRVAWRPASAGPSVGPPKGGHHVVPLLTLAEILAGDSPVIVKCNAEGAEFALVPQLIELGLRPALIVLMVHPMFGSAADLGRDLERAGYIVRDADDPPKGHRFHCVLPSQA